MAFTKEDVEFMRRTLKAVSLFYPGFLPKEMARNIDALCDTAVVGTTAAEPPPENLLEALASIEHDRWSKWMKYLFTKGSGRKGTFTISPPSVVHWHRQMNTPYSKLTDREKQSDRDQVLLYWPLIKKYKERK